MKQLILPAQKRTLLGKKTRALRAQGLIPAIVYGHATKPMPLQIKRAEFEKIFKEAGTAGIVDLQIEGDKSKKVLIHAPQTHPLTENPLHLDFYAVKMTEKIQTKVPIKIVGESKAVKELEGNLITNKDTITIECLPTDLIGEIKVDITPLETFEDQILVKDLRVPETVTILDEPEEVVVLITPPRSEEELEEILEKPTEEAVEEVEVTGEKKEEEEAEALEGAEGKVKTPAGEEGKEPPTEATPAPQPQAPAKPQGEYQNK